MPPHHPPHGLAVALLVLCSSACRTAPPAPAPAPPPTPPAKTEHPGRVLLDLKALQQTTDYTCGPACLVTLLAYYKRPGDEMAIADQARSTQDKGTTPQNMVTWLEGHGFAVQWGENGSLGMLRENLARGVPTLVEWIDWGGHWVLVVGYDTRNTETEDDDVILFADPCDCADDAIDGITRFNASRFDFMWFDAFLFDRPMYRVYITAVPAAAPTPPG